jgi:ABC-type nickel/cobalt efflux system permease component RcnA
LPVQAIAKPASDIWTWINERQRELTSALSNGVRRLKTENPWIAAAQLTLISFLYGVFHAVGPGHGKFVISSYALANAQTLRRGVLVSFMAAAVQALSAILIVGVVAVLLKLTSIQLRQTEAWLETASWGLVAVFGAWLLYRSLAGGGHVHAHSAAQVHDHGHGHGKTHAHEHAHAHGDNGHHHAVAHATAEVHAHAKGHGHDHHHDHETGPADACAHCGHAHVAEPAQLQGPFSWREAMALAFAVGIRPCTGAIAVLIVALGIGLFWAGVMAAFAMAIGTAITVSALAILAVTSRDLAKRVAGRESRWTGWIERGAAVGGSAAVLILGLMFFLASLQGGSGPI